MASNENFLMYFLCLVIFGWLVLSFAENCRYLSLFVLTLLLLLLWPTNGSRYFDGIIGHIRSLITGLFSRVTMKEKNEDEDCEYEMIWDAEGTMHLVKRALKAPTKPSSERSQVERYV